jgi:hypothetical protein
VIPLIIILLFLIWLNAVLAWLLVGEMESNKGLLKNNADLIRRVDVRGASATTFAILDDLIQMGKER